MSLSTADVIEEVETLATELHGRGTAVSVDVEGARFRVRVWDAKGMILEESEPGTRDQAARDMWRRLTS